MKQVVAYARKPSREAMSMVFEMALNGAKRESSRVLVNEVANFFELIWMKEDQEEQAKNKIPHVEPDADALHELFQAQHAQDVRGEAPNNDKIVTKKR